MRAAGFGVVFAAEMEPGLGSLVLLRANPGLLLGQEKSLQAARIAWESLSLPCAFLGGWSCILLYFPGCGMGEGLLGGEMLLRCLLFSL